MNNLQPLALTMGDPAGIGAECALKAWELRQENALTPFFIIDDIDHLKTIPSNIPLQNITAPKDALDVFNNALPVLNLKLAEQPKKGLLSHKNGTAVVKSIEMAVNFALDKQVAGVVTNPIHKAALYECGFQFPGHTEFLGSLCGLNNEPVMMLATEELRTVPLTVHIPLKDVSAAITRDLITQKVNIINTALRQDFGISNPHIAVAGLNPHAGEDGTIGSEEQDFINTVINDLKTDGINISGTYPADTMFHEEARCHYDVALCMYHDQALIPLKTLDFYGGVNVTLGLPIIRTSPDHGTALNIAGQGIANPKSLVQAIKMAGHMAKNRS